MRILIYCETMQYLSGSPLYNYELARELKKCGHSVTVVSDFEPSFGDGDKLQSNLLNEWIGCLPKEYINQDAVDVILASQMTWMPKVNYKCPIINIVHSEYDCENPWVADHYIAIRPSIKEHLVNEHWIPEEKITVIYNGVDRDRFSSDKRKKQDVYTVVAPCTIDSLRKKFLNHEISLASKDRKLIIIGSDFWASLDNSLNVEVLDPRFDVENVIWMADEVVWILLWRVNLEAWSMWIKSTIYDPETLEKTTLDCPIDFDEKHNIKNVVKDILNLIVNYINNNK